ncbi:hypothetical protein Pen01_02040 [Phytomonospora endophytica]|nr:hypothetical protein Pen01_02040 [Phytomonospora endophytica]
MAPTTGRPAAGDADVVPGVGVGELVGVGVVVLRWTIGAAKDVEPDPVLVAALGADVGSAETAGRSTVPSVGASGVVGELGVVGSVSRETVIAGVVSAGGALGVVGVGPSAARRETVGVAAVGDVEATTGIATGGGVSAVVVGASVAVGVPVPPSPAKGTGSTVPRVGACSSAILLTVCPTGNDLGEAGAAICSVTAGGSGAGVMSTADEIRGGPSPPRRRVGVAAGASTIGIAGASVERWIMGAPTGVAPEPDVPPTDVTASPDDPSVGDSEMAATGSGSGWASTGAAGVGMGSGSTTVVGVGVGSGLGVAASTTGRLQGSGVSTEPVLPPAGAAGAAGLTERSTDIPDGSDQRCTTDEPFGPAAAGGAACTTGRSVTSPPRTGTASTTPDGASGVTACPSGDRNPVVCLVVRPDAKSCGGLTSGCAPSTRWTGGMDRQSRRATGGGGTGDGDGGSAARSSLLSRLQGHRMVHRPPFTRVLRPAIWLTYSSLSACSRSRMSSRRQWKW